MSGAGSAGCPVLVPGPRSVSSVEARAIRSGVFDCVDMQLSASFGKVSCRQWSDHLSETSFTQGRSPKTSLWGARKRAVSMSQSSSPPRSFLHGQPLSTTFVTDTFIAQ